MGEAVRKFKETNQIKRSWFNRVRSHRYFPAASLGAFFLITAGVHVWKTVYVVQAVKEVATLRRENASLLDNLKKVNSDIASLTMASRIERYATDTLGMRQVDANDLFTLVRSGEEIRREDDLSEMLAAIKRVADYVPTLSENGAEASELPTVKFDSSDRSEGAE